MGAGLICLLVLKQRDNTWVIPGRCLSNLLLEIPRGGQRASPDLLQHLSVSSLRVLVFDNYFQSIVFQPDFHSFILC